MGTVYLAGPVTGCSYKECTDWRQYAMARLAESGITGLNPMRCKEALAKEIKIADSYDNYLSCPRGIMTRDYWDCTRCDVVLVNLLHARSVSIGSVMEIAWAFNHRIPIVLVMENENIHEHSMINEAAGFRAGCLDEAIAIIKAVL